MKKNIARCWLFLLISIVCEVSGTSLLKISQDSWQELGLACTVGLLCISYFFLSKAVEGIPLGVAYACWEALGLFLIILVSIFVIGETMSMMRGLGLLLVLGGVFCVHRGTDSGHGTKDDSADCSTKATATERGLP